MKNLISKLTQGWGWVTRQFRKLWAWVTHQFKEHTIRAIAVTVPVIAIVTLGILFLCGVFTSVKWSYLPNRAYLLADTDYREPQTLYELLHSDMPSAEVFLQNPSIAEELMNAEDWSDIVDSRFALNNLRELESQLETRLAEEVEYYSAAEYILPEDSLLSQSAEVTPTSPPNSAEATPTPPPNGDKPILRLDAEDTAPAASTLKSIEDQYSLFDKLREKTRELISPTLVDDENLIELEAMINLKGI